MGNPKPTSLRTRRALDQRAGSLCFALASLWPHIVEAQPSQQGPALDVTLVAQGVVEGPEHHQLRLEATQYATRHAIGWGVAGFSAGALLTVGSMAWRLGCPRMATAMAVTTSMGLALGIHGTIQRRRMRRMGVEVLPRGTPHYRRRRALGLLGAILLVSGVAVMTMFADVESCVSS